MASRSVVSGRASELLAPLLAGDQDGARTVLSVALRSAASRCDVYETIVVPCMREVGDLWHRGELSVPDEHLATETLTRVLDDLRCAAVADEDAPTAVVGCAPLDGHVLPTMLAADLLTDAGWRVWHLGGSTPAPELAAFVRRREPDLVVLTTTLHRTLAGAAAAASALREPDPEDGPAVMLAGEGVRDVAEPGLVGADALGRRLADLPAFARLVRSGVPLPTAPTAGRFAASAMSKPPARGSDRVLAALQEGGSALSMTELCERSGISAAEVGSALAALERAHQVRFVRGRWALMGPRHLRASATPGPDR